MRRHTILILGGTREGHALAAALVDHALFAPITSLAGRTEDPVRPPGEVRVGGFGGFTGLARYLQDTEVAAVIDATHPFAEHIGWNAATACALAGRPLLRLDRPPWRPGPDDAWTPVDTWEEAVAALRARAARRVMLALGRQHLMAFTGLREVFFLVRSVDAPDPPPPFALSEMIQARGPFKEEEEVDLMRAHRIDTLVCRNSGGPTGAKLAAARALGIGVIMRRRPPRPPCPRAETVGQTLDWLVSHT